MSLIKAKRPHKPDLMSVETVYDLYAEYYDSTTARHVEDLPMYQQITMIKSPPYLEVGCGTGRVLEYLLSHKHNSVKGQYLFGVDISDGMLSLSKEKIGSFIDKGFVRIKNHDFVREKLNDQKFHAAFVTYYTFNYIDKDLQNIFLENIRKALHPGGIIVLDFWCPELFSHPEKTNQWTDYRTIILGNRHIRFQQRLNMVTPNHEKRDWIFTESDGKTKKIITNRLYTSPQTGKTLLETAGFIDVLRVFNYALPGRSNFAEIPQSTNFVLLAKNP